MKESVYLKLRVCLTSGMDLAAESSSEGGLAIFVAQQALCRRVVKANYMSHRAFFGILHDLLKARSAPFSLLDLACGDAGCSVGALRGTNVSDYVAVDLSEPALSLAASNASSLRCATQVVRRDFQEYDFPENLRTFEQIALEGGFRSFEHLYTDPFCFYGAFHAIV